MTTGAAVLLLDDDPISRQTVRAVLASYGYAVLEARDTLEAVAFLESPSLSIRLLLAGVNNADASVLRFGEYATAFQPEIALVYMVDWRSVGLVTRVSRWPWASKPVGVKTLRRLARQALDQR